MSYPPELAERIAAWRHQGAALATEGHGYAYLLAALYVFNEAGKQPQTDWVATLIGVGIGIVGVALVVLGKAGKQTK